MITVSASTHLPTQWEGKLEPSLSMRRNPIHLGGKPARWGVARLEGTQGVFTPSKAQTYWAGRAFPGRTASGMEGALDSLLLQVFGGKVGGDNDGAGGGRKLRCDEGRRLAYAHLREGACGELEFLLEQGAQHLVLSFKVKHSFLQLDALLPQVLHGQAGEEEERRRRYGGGRMSIQFPSSELRAAPLGGRLSYPQGVANSLTLPPWREVAPIPTGPFPSPGASPAPLRSHTLKKGPYKADLGVGWTRCQEVAHST